jgi:Arc/MetJ family transcription regulator
MRTTIAIDDGLFAQAKEFAGPLDESEVVSEALKVYVQIQAGRQLARMGGTSPNAKAPPRRRPPNFLNDEDPD